MTNQEIFNKVLTHMREQKVGSRNGNKCMYRGDNNTACAVGCLIPDHIYSPKMENVGLSSLLESGKEPNPRELALRNALADSSLPSTTWPLLRELQYVHDEYMPMYEGENMDAWEDAMKMAAFTFNLNYTQP
jgi:hypothetical protein